ncbi:MAG: hypothetical protein KDC95_22590 [Planctomycetes bacterium]|nr:hypothetical protein [Planctomycetota bacterium]
MAIGLEKELARYTRQQQRRARTEACVRRGFVLLVPWFVIVAQLGLTGVVAHMHALVAFPIGFAVLLALGLLVWPPRLPATELDRRARAHDALATALLDRRDMPARPLLVRFAREAIAKGAAMRAVRGRRALRRALLLGCILLLAIWFFPGHAPLPGPASSGGGGAGDGRVASGGSGNDSKVPSAPRVDEREDASKPTEPERSEDKDENEKESSDAPKPPAQPRPLVDTIVFPDYRGDDKGSEREAPSIDRAPSTTPSRTAQQQVPKDRKNDEAAPDEPPDWERQKERALARGRLAPWEGRVLDLWGKALSR